MATLIAYQDGNFTGATTFKNVATGANANQTSGFNNTGQQFGGTTSYSFTPAFTMTNSEVIEGVMLNCRQSATPGTNQTMTVGISKDNGSTLLQEVTINVADLVNAQDSLVFFKFASTVTGDGNNTWKLGIKTSQANTLGVYRSATTNDFVRIFRQSTTATPATTDIFYICGERTGAGAVTPITVTMDSTANTSYGAMNIGDTATVSFGTSASTNYYLRLAGNLNVYRGGTLNIGTSGTRIPSTSTAILEFNNASAAQFGLNLLSGSTFNAYGAQKRSWSKLTADAASGQAVINVEDTTGWVANDVLAITRTDRQALSLSGTISAVNSSTQVTLTANLSVAVGGVFPYQGAVGNPNKNVIIRGISAANHGFVLGQNRANITINADSVTFTWLRDVRFNGTTTSTFNWQACGFTLMQATSDTILRMDGVTGTVTVDDCVFTTSTPRALDVPSGATVTDNLFIRCGNGSFGTANITGTFTGNFVANHGNGSAVTSAAAIGSSGATSISNNTFLCNSRFALQINSALDVTYATNNFIRNIGWGVIVSSGVGLVFDDCYFDGNSVANAYLASSAKFKDCEFNGGTGVTASTRELTIAAHNIQFENCDFGQTSTASNFIETLVANRQIQATFTNCDIAETLGIVGQDLMYTDNGTLSIIGFDKLNNTSGNHRAYKRYGYAGSDQSVYRTASPSEVLVPNSASGKLPSGSKKFGVASGNDATVSVWVRKSSTYNGAEPRLILKRNIVGGVTSDQVLDTAIVPMGAYDKPLDTYTGAAGAYSLRKLRTAYSGSAIRVRRSSDNTEQDIGFDANGHLDESALLSFVGSGNGFVRTWYDQSGNTRHAEQTTNANQPRIVNGGVVDKEKGRPTLTFDGSNDYLTNSALASVFTGSGTLLSSFTTARFNTSANPACAWGLTSTSSNNQLRFLGATAVSPNYAAIYQDRDDANTNTAFVQVGEDSTGQRFFSTFSNQTNSRSLFNNGVSKGINTVSLGTATLNTFSIGALVRTGLTHTINGNIQEVIIYNSDESSNRVAIETNIDDYYAITTAPTWQELTASTPTVTDDCVLEVYVDADGVQGSVNIDDWSIS